ncbi:serine hydrolase domain-containing protein [Sphingosinicella sp.]|uniref:serine hydrolase domain-containing protein n=1 Tax=Sphingosinicella sp. TaxID=1917971 RepID=UPI0035AF190C
MSIDLDDKAELLKLFGGTLMPGEVVHALLRNSRVFPYGIVSRGSGAPKMLSYSPQPFPAIAVEHDGRTFDMADFLSVNRVAGLLILKDGQVAFEQYELGLDADMHWASCSVAKSIASTLVGAAMYDGAIRDLDAPLTDFIEIGGPYAEVSLRQLLRMCTGVQWSEEYVDPGSERRKLLARQLEFKPRAVVEHMAGLSRCAPPGGSWAYNTGESYLVAAVLEKATGRPLTEYLSEKIWSRLGMEQDATWWLDSPGGMVVSGSGMGATLRDYARFGQFVLDDGVIAGERVVPEGWFKEAGSPFRIGERLIPYGYMWWMPELQDPELEGTFQAEGIYGQYIHLNPRERLVIVLLSARSKPNYRLRFELNDDAFFAAVARALK